MSESEETHLKLIVFGATGRVGTRAIAEALDRGHEVTAVVRDPAAELPDGVEVVVGDATDADSVASVAPGHEAAISAVGGVWRDAAPTTVYADSARALLEGLARAGVHRLVVVGGAGSLEVAPGLRNVDRPDFPDAHKPDALAQADGLEVYRAADGPVDWTYLSPPGLLEPGERTGSYRTGSDQLLVDEEGNSRISMEDYVIALLDEVENPRHVRRRFTVAA